MEPLKDEEQVIWMIDDDPIQHFCIGKSLRIQGLSKPVRSFFNGGEALAYFITHLNDFSLLPNIILLDLNMPYVNAWQFLQQYAQIKHRFQKVITIYVISSTLNTTEINKVTSIPEVSGFFSKPVRPDVLKYILTASKFRLRTFPIPLNEDAEG